MMNYREARNLIDEALRDIEQAQVLTGETMPQQAAAIYPAIAQAKLLAVIASALIEIKETQLSQI